MPQPMMHGVDGRRAAFERALGHTGLVVVETPRGFEAERFVDQLLQRSVPASEIVDPDAVTANAAHPSAILRAPLHTGLRGWRATVVRRYQEGRGTILVLPPGVSGDALIEEPVPTIVVDAAALRMSVTDVMEMATDSCGDPGIDPGVAELLTQLSDGWPLWIVTCFEAITSGQISPDQLLRTVAGPPFRHRVVRRAMSSFDRTDRHRLAQLAHFGRFTDRAAAAVGGIEFAENVLPHAPGLYRTPSGWLQFVEPVRLDLVQEVPLDPASAEALAPVLVADGQVLEACNGLLDAGLREQACRLIEGLPGNVIDTTDQRALLGVLRVLQERAPARPGLALKQARVHANLAEIDASIEACELACRRAEAHDPVRLEAAVELLLCRHRTIGQEEAADTLARLRREAPTTGPLPTRLREIEAQILGQSPDHVVVQAAADRFVEVASEWEFQQEYLRAAKALRGLAFGPLWHLGQFREAQTRLEKAARLAVSQTFDYGVTMVIKAFFDARVADWASFRRSSDQARFIIAESGLRWLGAYLELAAAYEASAQRSVTGVRTSVRTALDLLGPLYEGDTGLVFTCESAVLMAEVGEHDEAEHLMAGVAHRADQNPVEFAFAQIVLAARRGDARSAQELWAEAERTVSIPNDRRWRLELEITRSIGCEAGDSGAGQAGLTTARREAQRLDLEQLLPVLAPECFLDEVVHRFVRVEVLGPLRVTNHEGVLDVPEGHVTALITALAVNGGRVTIDAIVDRLWPSSEYQLGIRRLKNVVAKARAVLGADALVREHHHVSFAEFVQIDAVEFEKAATEAEAKLRFNPGESRSAAIAAIEAYRGPLLHGEEFDDDVAARRLELSRRAERILSMLEAEHQPNASWVASATQRIGV